MTNMMQALRQFMNEEEGLVSAEYALLLGLIAVALMTAVTNFQNAIANAYANATNAFSS